MPPDIGELTQLKELVLEFNKLESLPTEAKNLRNLERLYLRMGNNISQQTWEEILGWYVGNQNFQIDGDEDDVEEEEEDEGL